MPLKISAETFNLIRKFVVVRSDDQALADRTIEYSFVISRLLALPRGKILDVGCTEANNLIPLVLNESGWDVWGIDGRKFIYENPSFHFMLGDIRKTEFIDANFDYIYAVSTLEHIGLRGRYDVVEDDERGDAKAVKEMRRILRPNGVLLITIPFGVRTVVRPLHRVYDGAQVDTLFSDWNFLEALYYIRRKGTDWKKVSRNEAEQADYSKGIYGLALLKLAPK
jgi:SAM-dependent methyltransferase